MAPLSATAKIATGAPAIGISGDVQIDAVRAVRRTGAFDADLAAFDDGRGLGFPGFDDRA